MARVKKALAILTVGIAGLFAGASVACHSADGPPGIAPPPRPVSAPDPRRAEIPMADHAYAVANYTLRASLDPIAHTLHGEGTITWRNASSRPISELWMHLYLNAFKNQSSVFMREPIGGFRGGTTPSDWGTIDLRRILWLDGAERHDLFKAVELHRPDDTDETDARIPLPRTVAPGELITLDVAWDDKLPSIVERTGYDGSFHMVGQWFPKIAKVEPDGTFAHFPFHHLAEFYADYGTYDVTVDVPANFVIGATGPAVESRVENGRRIERHVQGDIHDFAWTAWDRFRSRKEVIDGVDVTILYPPGRDAVAERELAAMRFALPHFGRRYGRYPYPVLTVMHPPSTATEAGGMEYPTLITTGEGGSPYMPEGVRIAELTTIHEFGHQYFYGLIASNEMMWPFLDEGLNTYAEAECVSAMFGAGSAAELLGLKVSDIEAHAERARHPAHDERVAQPSHGFDTGNQYGSLVYSRTGTILETVRRSYGDQAMQRTMGTYARRFRFRHPTPDDLISTFRTEMGDDVAELLKGAFFGKGWVDFTVTAVSSHAAHAPAGIFDVGGKRETVTHDKITAGKFVGWVLVTRRGPLKLPVEIELVAVDGTRTRVPWDGVAESIRVPYSGGSPLRAATVDPDHKVLLDQDPENNFATAPGQQVAGAPRTLERATYWAELLLGAFGP